MIYAKQMFAELSYFYTWYTVVAQLPEKPSCQSNVAIQYNLIRARNSADTKNKKKTNPHLLSKATV